MRPGNGSVNSLIVLALVLLSSIAVGRLSAEEGQGPSRGSSPEAVALAVESNFQVNTYTTDRPR